MNRNKIKFKYLLNLWRHLPEYPTKEDVIYELNVFLVKDGRPDGDFSQQTFKSVFGSNWDKSKHGEILNELIKSGEFVETQKPRFSRHVGSDRRDRIGIFHRARFHLLPKRKNTGVNIRHEGVEMDPLFRCDLRHIIKKLHQHRLAAAH